MSPHPLFQSRWLRAGALSVVVAGAAALAIALQRNGHGQGDDFALYLRQARSVFDGDVGAVVADNRFAVLNSDVGFSPIAYPWVWPLLLSPFVHAWGLDYDRLKLIEVGLFAVWLVLLHGIVRRRIGRWAALAVIAVIGTAPAFLVHADQLLSEYPYLVAMAIVLWWYDRLRARGSLLTSSFVDLVILGSLVTVAFNVRREGMVLIGVIAVMQAGELAARVRDEIGQRFAALLAELKWSWRSIVVPHATFVVTVVGFQLLLPTSLFPDNGNGVGFIDDRFVDYPAVLTEQLGLGKHPAVGVVILAIAAIGVVIGIRRRPWLDTPLALTAVFSALIISTHFRTVARYWFQVTPWVVYFIAVAAVTVARLLLRRRAYIALAIGLVPLVFLVGVHAAVVPGDVADALEYDADGRIQVGPAHPDVAPVYAAVRQHTPPTAVIAFFRARTMTLLTDRRSIQTTNVERIRQRADYFAQRRGSTFWQPDLSAIEAGELGFEMVWSDSRWILWRVNPP